MDQDKTEEDLKARAQAEYDKLRAAAEEAAAQREAAERAEEAHKVAEKMAYADSKPTIGNLVASLSEQASTLVRGEIEHAQLSLKSKVTKLGIGGVMLAVAGVIALYAVGMLFHTLAWVLATWLPVWAGFLIVTGVLFLVTGIVAFVGLMSIKKSQRYKVDPKQALNKDINAIKDGLKK